MARKKSVAAKANPTPAVQSDELQVAAPATEPVSAEAKASVAADSDRQSKVANLAKARAARSAKLAAKKVAAQTAEAEAAKAKKIALAGALAEEEAADQLSFGRIQEVAKVAPQREEYIRVDIPLTDIFDHSHPGVQLNRHKFEPGKTYLLRADVALEVKRRLAMFHDEQVRLLRPNADRKALSDVNKGSQWTSRGSVHSLDRDAYAPVAPDEAIYTVDF